MPKNKLNKIESLSSNALDDSKISHEEFDSITTEKNSYENIKENIKNDLESTAEIMVDPSFLEPISFEYAQEIVLGTNSIKRKKQLKKMERKKKQTYCLACRDYTKSINPKIVRNKQNRYIMWKQKI